MPDIRPAASPPATIPDLVVLQSRRAPEAPALVADGLSVSFGDLDRRSSGIAAALAGAGVRPGDIVLLWMANSCTWLEAFLACARIGAPVFAANIRFRAVELAEILRRCRPRAVLYRPSFRGTDLAAILGEASDRAGWRPPLEIPCGDAGPGGVLLDDLVRGAAGTDLPGPQPDDRAVMFATSGTTSAPKYVVHTHRSVTAHGLAVAEDFGMSAADAVMLQALPYCGVFGFCQAMAALAAGRPSVLTETYDAANAAGLIARHAVSHFNATDDMLAALAGTAPVGALDTLRLVGAASFNRGPETLEEISVRHGIPVVGLYGMSEIQALFARRALDDPPDRRFRGGGRPVCDAAAVRVRDPGTGRLCGPGSAGELEIRGPSLLAAYHDDAAATAGLRDRDGFVRTGDLGMLDEDGGFTFLSRMDDALRLGGFLVNPAEIAGFISAIDGVRDCQVVGVRDGGRLRAAAFVVMDDPGAFAEARIVAECCRELAPFKVPVLVHALDEFPVVQSSNGVKIQRGELRCLAEALIGK